MGIFDRLTGSRKADQVDKDYREAIQLIESPDAEEKRRGILKLFEIVELAPAHFDAHLALSKICTSLSKLHDDGIKHALNAFELQPHSPDARSMLSFAYFIKGKDYDDEEDWDNAFESYKLAIEAGAGSETNEAVVFGLLSVTAEPGKANRESEFADFLAEFIQKNPSKKSRRYMLAMTLLDLKRHKEALATMLKFEEEHEPNNPDSHYGLARVYIAMGNASDAQKELNILDRLDPEQANELRSMIS